LKARNESRLLEAIQAGKLECFFESHLREIAPQTVRLELTRRDSEPASRVLENDDVFIMAGGVAPFALLEKCGVSFDPADRPAEAPLAERGSGLLHALAAALALSISALVWTLLFRDYYRLPDAERPLSELHDSLRSSSPIGLGCGVAATLLIAVNLSYLLRRNWLRGWIPGSLTSWMTSHVVTGILAFLLALIHAGMAPRATLSGHAFAALGILVITGAIGRYFYSFVPRAANGKELALEEVNNRLAAAAADWDRLGRGFGDQARQEIHALVAAGKWQGSFFQRLVALLRAQKDARMTCRRLRETGHREGLSDDQIERLTALAQRAYRTALVSAHYEDLRALLNSWRFFHRWVALLMVLLAAAHICVSLYYGSIFP
jgi:hypothetical protein